MTSISIIGAGSAASIHASAAEFATDVELVGVVGGQQSGSIGFAEQFGVEAITFTEAISRSDALIVAVPPADMPAVLATIDQRVGAVLAETPSALSTPELVYRADRPPTMLGCNLLHAPATRRAFSQIEKMTEPQRFALHHRGARPNWGCHGTPLFGGGAVVDPGCRLLPVLLAAIGSTVVSVSADLVTGADGIDTSASLHLTTDQEHQSDVTMEISWGDEAPSTSLEVAGDDEVVRLELLPPVTVEFNGDPITPPGESNPLIGLGYAAQITRLGAIARGDAAPWPDYELAAGIIDIATAAAFSSTHQGLDASPGVGYPQRSVWTILSDT